jgi:hypothetical protein
LPDLLDIQCVTQNTHSAQPGGCHVLRVSSSPEKEMPNKKWLGCIMRIYLEARVFVRGKTCRDWMWCALPSDRRAVSVAIAIAIAPSGNALNSRNAQKSSSVIRPLSDALFTLGQLSTTSLFTLGSFWAALFTRGPHLFATTLFPLWITLFYHWSKVCSWLVFSLSHEIQTNDKQISSFYDIAK